MDNITRILAYLDGKLEGAEKKSFEEELTTNVNLKQELEFYQNLRLVGEVFGKGGVKAQLENVWATKQASQTKQANSTWRYAVVAIVLIATGVWVVWQLNRSKNWWQNQQRYAQVLQQQKKRYAHQRLPALDAQMAQQRGITAPQKNLPAIDTLLKAGQEVVFSWNSASLKGQKLELEVFTKATQSQPKRWDLPKSKAVFKTSLPPGFYYWRLNIKGEETVGFGRFYVVK
ncbi:hypothetical protein [uncultured Microscilla sp.]|uniref:hypothetical protein n=1 Tax=uncultured Microscilla sp. TaxID=432653 RepID=UPI00261A2F67|nr:hypothetical protein [uncultured Microscilla sp.]